MSYPIQRAVRDTSWVRRAFLVPSAEADKATDRYMTTAKLKFADSSVGGNKCINPPPQFTRTADIKVENIFTAKNSKNIPVTTQVLGNGIGRYYSEAIDDNVRYISMRFGVAKYNSLTTFFTGFYNSDAGMLARTGRAGGLFYNIGKAAGFVVPMLSLPLLFINFTGNLLRYLTMKPSSKYYYLKPTMPLYWNAVTSIVNDISVNRGIVPRYFGDDEEIQGKLDNKFPFKSADMTAFQQLMPDIIMEGGGFNVYALSTRYQRIARRVYQKIESAYDNTAISNTTISDFLQSVIENGLKIESIVVPSFTGYLNKWFGNSQSQPTSTSVTTSTTTSTTTTASTTSTSTSTTTTQTGDSVAVDPGDGVEKIPEKESDLTGFAEFLEAELDDGSAFVTFRVDDDNSSVNESFSNSVGESEISMKLNSMSGEARSSRFSFAGGNITDGLIGQIVGTAMSSVSDVLSGVAAGMGMSGLAALAGSAFVDIPKHWQNSIANLPSMNYSVRLTSPYGNSMSQMLNIYIPLAMLLAAALPLSTGKQSYTSPFLCEAYDKGRAQTRLGIFESLNITRGVGNLPFDNNGNCMAIDVSWSIKDLSSVMHMPIVHGANFLVPTTSFFDDDTAFSDYMAVLGNLSLEENIYPMQRAKLALTKAGVNMRSRFSKAHMAQEIGSWLPFQLWGISYPGIVNR